MKPLLISLLLASSTLLGCIGPVEIAPLPDSHPANPDAPAGMLPAVGSALTLPSAGGGVANGVSPHAAEKAQAVGHGKFQCPMHSHVRSEKPGRCPICGMRLVNRDDDAEHNEVHER